MKLSETAKSMGLGKNSINPLNNYVDEVDEYPKINLTTIRNYKEDPKSNTPVPNVSVIGRMNNLKV